ncbi:MAG TPA: PVC-type heme-binding CxxCH protein [Chitinophagaceae bacterium]|nr:PVC-type heme-binding CxxCH protein [Chitinophagaceae bacterium]
MKKLVFILSFIFILFSLIRCNSNEQKTSTKAERDTAYNKLSDEEKRLSKNALAGLDVADGLQASLFASEPMMGNPTNIDIDSKGRIWVCEAFNYRPKLNPGNPQREEGDRILILEDTNRDGKADTAKVFYQGTDVNAALGIAVLGNKVIVSCSPNVFLFTDTNGDDKADTKELLFTHVGGEQHDHAIHSFTFGPDGKLYFNFGNAGERLMDKNGKIIIDKDGNEVTNEGKPYRQGMVFRMNEDGSDFEVLAHNFRNNYEAAVDAYGTIWQSDNDDDGNQGTRINYVMEFGNYGYTDEMTGAGWRSRRTNMEPEIPKRHWHQNDPGSIPNLLFTGAGSPAGMCFYEGTLLPAVFQNQMIHCEAGNNIVRSYVVEKDGAGYKAHIEPILEGTRDQWFRPVDVCAAPDGSIFVADWYDPGVGGHQMVDMNRGRIFRMAPSIENYKIPEMDLSSADGAVEALKNPNGATRYLAWKKLKSLGAQAETVLQKLWASDNPVYKTRALWLLARIPGKEDTYIQKALEDKNPDIRITGLRAAREIKPDIIPYAKKLIRDSDPQVRREVAIALHHNKSIEAPELWAELAMQYDGNDRWYLEALGIGADKQWEAFLNAYKNKAGEKINDKAGRDIVWRSRTGIALPLLAKNIEDNNVSDSERLKYFRAFDFINAPGKEDLLLGLLNYRGPNRQAIWFNTLNELNASGLSKSPKMQSVLRETLDSIKGTQEFVTLLGKYKLPDYNKDLLQITLAMPDSSLGTESANLLINSGGSFLLKNEIKSNDSSTAKAALKALAGTGSNEGVQMVESIIKDPSVSIRLREDAVRMLAAGWNESEKLLQMVKEGQLPKELKSTAAIALSATYRKDIRQESLKYLQVNESAGGKTLPTINELAKLNGNITSGKQIFSATCATCHKIDNEGENVGPALSKIGSKLTKDALYIAIIHPDEGISFGYEGYVFKMKDGNVVAGIITSETEDAVEIVMQGGIKKKLEKPAIASRIEMKNSLMPATLYQTLTQQQLVDLVEYLHSKTDKPMAVK